MSFLNKKLDVITVLAIVIMAISITIFNLEDFSWEANSKSYLGLIVFVVLLVFRKIYPDKK